MFSIFSSRHAVNYTLLLGMSLGGIGGGCHSRTDLGLSRNTTADEVHLDDESIRQIERFCGDCHVLPRPESFPRDAWHDEVLRGYQFYAESGRHELAVPPIVEAIHYFRSRAPEHLTFSQSPAVESSSPVHFRRESIELTQQQRVPPAVAHLTLGPSRPNSSPVLWACDMRRGEIAAVNLGPDARRTTMVGRLQHPCHLEFADLNRDQQPDLIVADLGSFDPADHQRGRVLWLATLSGEFKPAELAAGFGRVADVRAADFDGDADQDLIVAEFGMHKTGGIHLLRNDGPDESGVPRFTKETIDDRPGAIHVPPMDINGDGQLDFVALISQEFEEVTAYLNQGDRRFTPHRLWQAPDPAWGSSGIELVDLDQDGDHDILYSNGDTFDSLTPKPYHGLQWLENVGGLEFRYHRLCDLPGAYRAVAGDLDLDGDQDVVAVAWLPRTAVEEHNDWLSVIWLEQTSPTQFQQQVVEQGSPNYAASLFTDLDLDGDLDIVLGWHLAHTRESKNWLSIWWNETRSR